MRHPPIDFKRARKLVSYYFEVRRRWEGGEQLKVAILVAQMANQLGFKKSKAWQLIAAARNVAGKPQGRQPDRGGRK